MANKSDIDSDPYILTTSSRFTKSLPNVNNSTNRHSLERLLRLYVSLQFLSLRISILLSSSRCSLCQN